MKKISFALLFIAFLSAGFISCGGSSGSSGTSGSSETYTVTYNGNGNIDGTAPADTKTYKEGDSVTVLGSGDLENGSYVFGGWNTASDSSGKSFKEGDTFTMGASNVTLYAKWESPASAAFTSDMTTGYASMTVHFTDQSAGTVASWAWDFGDGSASTEQNPVHKYTSAGTYTVKLTIEGNGKSDYLEKSGYISVLAAGNVIFVNGDVTVSGDGSSWLLAYKTISEAVTAASNSDQIWIKKGTYTLSSTLDITKQVCIYGGFAGTESTDSERDSRDYTTNTTTIDGTTVVNSSHSVTTAGYHWYVDADYVKIDGITFINGYDSDGGGGIQSGNYDKLTARATTITNCTFTDNYAGTYGGAVWNSYGNMTVENCTFTDNYSSFQAGALGSQTTGHNYILNCTFSGNHGNNAGAIFIHYYDKNTPSLNTDLNIVTGCKFDSNISNMDGGAIICDPDVIVTNCVFTSNTFSRYGTFTSYGDSGRTHIIRNCLFANNSGLYGCGIGFNGSGGCMGSNYIINCTFTGNTATSAGGAIYFNKAADSTSVTEITNCILYDNTVTGTAADMQIGFSSSASAGNAPDVSYCDINQSTYSAANNNICKDPLLDSFYKPGLGSLCIDAGNNEAPYIYSTDLAGNSRIINGTIDIGAYEYK